MSDVTETTQLPAQDPEAQDPDAEGAGPSDRGDQYLRAVQERIVPKPGRNGTVAHQDWQDWARPTETIYEIRDRPEPPPIPNGWYSIVSSADLAPGDIRPVIAVGRELVTYRTEAGEARVIDAHCPHLGAHLGGGWVTGEHINCPYHGWTFDGDGTCVDISYTESRIPSRACIPTYPVVEQDGFVYFWYHAGGVDPQYEIPRVSEYGDPEWSKPHTYRFELKAALAEMAENNVDYAHFQFVHRRGESTDNSSSVFKPMGYFSEVIEQLPDMDLSFTRYTWGPGIALMRITDLMTIYATTTPIDRFHARLNWHFHFPLDVEHTGPALIEGVTGEFGLMADVPIWRDKVYRKRPVLVKGDGNIAEFRQWYSQFFEGSDWEP